MGDELLLALTVRNVCCLKGSTEEAGGGGRGGVRGAGTWDGLIGLLLRTLSGAATSIGQPWVRSRAGQGEKKERDVCCWRQALLLTPASGWLQVYLLPREKGEGKTAIIDCVWISGHCAPDPPQDKMLSARFCASRDKKDLQRPPSRLLIAFPSQTRHPKLLCFFFQMGNSKHVYHRRRGLGAG